MEGKVSQFFKRHVLDGGWRDIEPGPIHFRIGRIRRASHPQEADSVEVVLELCDKEGNLLQSFDAIQASEGDTIHLASFNNKKINLSLTDDGVFMDLVDEG